MGGTDQASLLRDLVASQKKDKAKFDTMKSIAIVSGKGGVGKTNLAVNLALAFGEMGKRTAILDADLGLANVDLLLGVVPKYHLGHVIKGERTLDEIIIPINDRVSLIPGGAGIQYLADMDDQQLSGFIDKLSVLDGRMDMLVVDTGAGIHRNVISFALSADEVLVITTPEPTAIRDSYGVLKSLANTSSGKLNVGVVVNMVSGEEEARDVASRLLSAAQQFLGVEVLQRGYIVWDKHVIDAVKQRKPFMGTSGASNASKCVKNIAEKIMNVSESNNDSAGKGIKSFLFRLAKRMQARG